MAVQKGKKRLMGFRSAYTERFNTVLTKQFNALCEIYGNELGISTIGLVESRTLSFMSHDFSLVNNFIMMIDLFALRTDKRSQTCIIDVLNNMIEEVPEDTFKQIRSALSKRYGINYDNGAYKMLMSN